MILEQVGFQLYSCHDLLKTRDGIIDTFKRLRKVGYSAVEFYGVGTVSPEELSQIAHGEGFTVCGSHESSEELLSCPEKSIERLAIYKTASAAYPFPGGIDLNSRAAIDDLIAKLQRSGEVLAKAGLTLSYHNHNQEFRKIDGKMILDRIYDGTSKDALKAELDTFWVQRGGGNVLEWIDKVRGRIEIIHLKDYGTNDQNEAQICEIGAGNLNFKAIVEAAEKAGARWFVVEQDTCPGDPVDSLAQSFRYIQENLV